MIFAYSFKNRKQLLQKNPISDIFLLVVFFVGIISVKTKGINSAIKGKKMKIIGLGTDITECARLEQILIKHEDNFLQMVYTEQEIAYCCGKKQKIQHLTGRWAAKEAVLKALGTGWIQGITWKDVEVRNAPSGKPSIVLSGGALDAAKRQGIDDILISISHCDSYAVASAVAFGRD